MNSIRLMGLIVFASTMILVAGCATAPKPPRMLINIDATPSINPDLDNRPSPVVISIYTLRGSSIFKNARFIELYTNTKDVLGVDYLDVQEVEVSPGETLNMTQRELPVEARHVGVIAAFRDIDNSTWRGIIDIEAGEKFNLKVHVDKLSLSIAKD